MDVRTADLLVRLCRRSLLADAGDPHRLPESCTRHCRPSQAPPLPLLWRMCVTVSIRRSKARYEHLLRERRLEEGLRSSR